MKKDIILSGVRPTGRLHLGNFLGLLKNLVKLQEDYDCYFFIADLHSLNEPFDAKDKQNQIINLAADYLAIGLNPKKSTIFVQSQVHEHSELAVILSNFIPSSFLFRMTQYKEKSNDRASEKVNSGLLYYPILMAADILIYKSTLVPVGQDQTQHVELARDAAGFFNNQFGPTFPEPKPLYTETPKVMSLLDPAKKMSKSLGDSHCLYIDEEPESIAKKLAKCPTDAGDGSSFGAQNLLSLAKIFCEPKVNEKFLADKKIGQLHYAEVKQKLGTAIADYFADFRRKKHELLDNPAALNKILTQGSRQAQKIAGATLEEVKKKIGLSFIRKLP